MKIRNLVALSFSLMFLARVAEAQEPRVQPPKLGSMETSDTDCKRLFRLASEGTSSSDPDETQYDTLALLQCSLLAQNSSARASSEYVGVARIDQEGRATVEVMEIAKEGAKQASDVRKTCEVIAKGVAGLAVPVSPLAATYASTFGVVQCAPLAKEVTKKNPLILMLPSSYVGPYVLAKGGWKSMKQAVGDFAKESLKTLPKDDKETILIATNPTAAVTLSAAKGVCKKLKLSKKC